MRRLFRALLYCLAAATLRRHATIVIGVTGSVGKTTTKDSAAIVLATKYRVRASAKSYNNEFGLPLTVLGEDSPGRSLIGWVALIVRSCARLLYYRRRSYPEVLLLEMGADHPGDLAKLTALARPKISVVTAIASAHLEFFTSLDEVAKEKRTLFSVLPKDGVAIMNADDELVAASVVPAGVRVLRYGFSECDVRAHDVITTFEHTGETSTHVRAVTNFKVTTGGSTVPVHLYGLIGVPAVTSALAAIAIGVAMDINVVDAAHALASYQGTPGRLRLLPGVRGTTLIDDSYNASPKAALAALDVLASIPIETGQWRWAVLGSMAELGSDTESGHMSVGEHIVKRGITGLVTVGERARIIAQAARKAGMDPHMIFSFAKATEAGHFLQDRLQAGDIALVKGSQVMRMELVVKELLAEPLRAEELLVRQGPEWQ